MRGWSRIWPAARAKAAEPNEERRRQGRSCRRRGAGPEMCRGSLGAIEIERVGDELGEVCHAPGVLGESGVPRAQGGHESVEGTAHLAPGSRKEHAIALVAPALRIRRERADEQAGGDEAGHDGELVEQRRPRCRIAKGNVPEIEQARRAGEQGTRARAARLRRQHDRRQVETGQDHVARVTKPGALRAEQEVEHGDRAEKRPRPAELALPRFCERRIVGHRWPGEGGGLGSAEVSSSESADGAPDSRRKIAPRRQWGPAMEVSCFGALRRMRCHGRLLDSPRTCASGPAAEGRPAPG